MKKESGLSYSELLDLDSLITAAQQRGLSLDEEIRANDEEEAKAALHVAMWETRHNGFHLNEKDLVIIEKIRELATQLEYSPTLGQLIQLRGEALRNQGGL